jgi:outer membrane protein assembly factor BamB
VTAVDLAGEVIWQEKVGPYVSEWGYGSSLALYRGRVIVSGENKGDRIGHWTGATSYLAALDGRTGEVVWRVRRPRAFSYGTPVVADVGGRAQLLLAGAEGVTSHDPGTGQLLWSCRWEKGRTANSLAWDDQHVYATRTMPAPEVVCVRADGSGDVTDTHLVWRQSAGAADVPSPLAHGGRLYLVTDAGVAHCLDAKSGELIWKQRLPGAVSASLLRAGERLYAFGEQGAATVFGAGSRYRQLARNRLGGETFATPAASGDRLFVRTTRFLYALVAKTAATARSTGPGKETTP